MQVMSLKQVIDSRKGYLNLKQETKSTMTKESGRKTVLLYFDSSESEKRNRCPDRLAAARPRRHESGHEEDCAVASALAVYAAGGAATALAGLAAPTMEVSEATLSGAAEREPRPSVMTKSYFREPAMLGRTG